MTDLEIVTGIFAAAVGGAAVGIERQRSGHATGVSARFGGIRTFTLLGGLSGLAGGLFGAGWNGVAIVLVVGAVAIVVAGYIAASRRDVDGTTEVAALVVIAAGVLAGLGRLAVASGVVAVTTLLLVEKSRLHAFVGRINDEELRAAAQFGVMAVVILPLLPDGPFGPFDAVRPRELWLLVLFFTGLSFAGYLARRSLGPRQGYAVAGLLGGLISSTNVTLTYSRLSRTDTSSSGPLATGIVGACTALFPRVLLATAVLDGRVTSALAPYLVAPIAVGVVGVIIGLTRRGDPVSPAMPRNPLQLGSALQMAATFQVVLFAVALARQAFGEAGLVASGAALGLTDVDAMTVSIAKSTATGVAPGKAAEAIAVGILVNSVLKLIIAVVIGSPRLRRIGGGMLAGMTAAAAASLWVW
jgi:uncharacterized membrane protein (DUF4010 family)